MKRATLEPAYVLHRRSYRETSFLVDIFSANHGRLTLLARGVRKIKSATSGLLQPFTPLLISWSGKGELLTLTQVEMHGVVKRLSGESLFAGFYLNELLMCLLHKWDAHPNLYPLYEKTLDELQLSLQQKTLRAFEKYLLEELGYGLLPKSDQSLQYSLLAECFYRFIPEQGFVETTQDSHTKSYIFSGKSLLAIAAENWHDEETLQDAKRLTRFMLASLLGARQIHSRRLFIKQEERITHED